MVTEMEPIGSTKEVMEEVMEVVMGEDIKADVEEEHQWGFNCTSHSLTRKPRGLREHIIQ